MKSMHPTILLLLALALSSCTQPFGEPPGTRETAIMRTALADARTRIVETQLANAQTSAFWTQVAIPTLTPDLSLPTPFPGSQTRVPPGPDERVYTDPAGWYALNFPAFMKPSGMPGAFAGRDYVFATGYLPYMTRKVNLCMWVANVIEKPEESSLNPLPPCYVSVQTGDGFTSEYQIYENPAADPGHRFFYIKKGKRSPNLEPLEYTLSWLKPPSAPQATPGPLSAEERAFWEDPGRQLRGVSIKEYLLPPEAQVGPAQNIILIQHVPEEAKPDWGAIRAAFPPATPAVETQLKALGYELVGPEGSLKKLYRDDRLLFDKVGRVWGVYHFSTDAGPINAFVVSQAGFQTYGTSSWNGYLIINDEIRKWDLSWKDLHFAPILYKGELLWAQNTPDSHIQIKKSNQELIFTFETYEITGPLFNGFRSWNGHWFMFTGDFVVQDGEILNQKLGYHEIIEWALIRGRPAYLFQRGARLGLAYGDKVLSLDYQNVGRGYCCGYASDNPVSDGRSMHFFAQRDGVWYYVVIDWGR